MQIHGATASFRKLTPKMIASQKLAMANEVVKTTKSEVALALKKAAPVLGIDGTTYHVLDILIGLTAADDWKQDRKPLVAISNEKLAEYVCRSTRTVIRSLKKLVEAGVLAFKDSPTGRRYIHRSEFINGKLGEIERGFGLDFSPARQRVQELKELGKAFAARLKAEKDAKRTVTCLSRALEDMIQLGKAQGVVLTDVEAALYKTLETAQGALQKAEILTMIYEEATSLLATHTPLEQEINEQMSCAGDTGGSSYNHTNPQDSKRSSNKQQTPNAVHFNSFDAEVGIKEAHEKEPFGKINAKPPLPALDQISINLISSATSQTQETLGTQLTVWSDLFLIAEDLCLMLGLSTSGWVQAENRIGRHAAAAVLITTVEKALRDPQSISSPAGYFRACIDRATEGNLALHRSLFGLAHGPI